MKKQTIPSILLVMIIITVPQAFAIGNNEWLDINMEFSEDSAGNSLTITCEKDADQSLNMLMTIYHYENSEVLAVGIGSEISLSEIITLDSNSTIQAFCEYMDESGNKAGYAIMRTFTTQ